MAEIRRAVAADAGAICDIYNHYIENTIATFEEQSIVVSDLAARMDNGGPPWLVAVDAGNVVGYAYAGTWRSRCAFRYTLESSVYLNHQFQGRGVGKMLYQALMEMLSQTDCRALVAAISLPNQASITLHQRLGFKEVGVFREVGFKFDQWIDVAFWEYLFTDEPG